MKTLVLRRPLALVVLAALVVVGGGLGETSRPVGAVVPGTNGLIAFSRLHDGHADIYVMSATGELGKHAKKAKRLTRNKVHDFDPAWPPDGTQIAFASERAGSMEIYVMDADGDNQTRLTTDEQFDVVPAWSPDGTQIAFSSSDGVVTMAPDGSNPRVLTKRKGGGEPDWQALP